jgi:hypothetical protein
MQAAKIIIVKRSYLPMKFTSLRISVDNVVVVTNVPKLLKPIISQEGKMIMIDHPSSREAEEMIEAITMIMIDHPSSREAEEMIEAITMIMIDHPREVEVMIGEMIEVMTEVLREVSSHQGEALTNVVAIEMTS